MESLRALLVGCNAGFGESLQRRSDRVEPVQQRLLRRHYPRSSNTARVHRYKHLAEFAGTALPHQRQ